MSTISPIAEQRVVLESVCWATYVALTNESETNRGRISYNQGVLEIMSPMLSHESAKGLLGRMVEQFTLVREIDMRSAASTTFRRSDLQRGFEADESYYIQHAIDIRGKEEIDLADDPPPDLVIEIEITRSSLNKQDLFAAMGIAEIWRYDGRALSLWVLQGSAYSEVQESTVLAGFPVSLAEKLLGIRAEESETQLIRQFVTHLN